MVIMALYLANSYSKSSVFAEGNFFLLLDFPAIVMSLLFLQTSCLLEGDSGLNEMKQYSLLF